MELDTFSPAQKERALHELLRDCARVMIAYSGGVDSAYLAQAAVAALGHERVQAVTGLSPSYPAVQREMARRVTSEFAIPHLEIETHELDDPNYAANPTNRCYFCKTELFSRLVKLAKERGYEAVLEGSNADDLSDHRPGHAAARELGVRSPLQEVGLTKADIRELSRRAGLPTWEVPASPCLASRIAYGTPVTPQRLRRIEEAERRLREVHAWRQLRVRAHAGLARLEVAVEDLAELADPRLRDRAAAALQASGFARACVDLQGYRRGALNEAGRVSGEAGTSEPDPGHGATPAADGFGPLGVAATIERAGDQREVAVLSAEPESLASLLRDRRALAVARCREAGGRFAALELY